MQISYFNYLKNAFVSRIEAGKNIQLNNITSNIRHRIFTMKLISFFFSFHYSSASNRIIHAKDHASVQLSVAEVDPNTGTMTGTSKTYAICGAIRGMGESDDCIARLAKRDNLLTK